jgi:hypothetical protein
MAQAELEKSNVFMSGTATDARSCRVVPLKFHWSRYDLLRVSRPRAFSSPPSEPFKTTARRRFTFVLTHSFSPIAIASMRWRKSRACRRCWVIEDM